MVILDTLGLVTCQVSVTPAWSCSSQNPRGSELAELGDTESNPHTGKLSQREDGACPESQSLFPYPFSYVQRGSFLESGAHHWLDIPPPYPGASYSFPSFKTPSRATSSMQPPQISPGRPFLFCCAVPWTQYRREGAHSRVGVGAWVLTASSPCPQLPMQPRPD